MSHWWAEYVRSPSHLLGAMGRAGEVGSRVNADSCRESEMGVVRFAAVSGGRRLVLRCMRLLRARYPFKCRCVEGNNIEVREIRVRDLRLATWPLAPLLGCGGSAISTIARDPPFLRQPHLFSYTFYLHTIVVYYSIVHRNLPST